MVYIFPGLSPFIERAARANPAVTEPHLVKCQSLWHCRVTQDALGQVPRVAAGNRQALLDCVTAYRESLAATLEGIDAAIAEVTRECCTPEPEPERKPFPNKRRHEAVAVDA